LINGLVFPRMRARGAKVQGESIHFASGNRSIRIATIDIQRSTKLKDVTHSPLLSHHGRVLSRTERRGLKPFFSSHFSIFFPFFLPSLSFSFFHFAQVARATIYRVSKLRRDERAHTHTSKTMGISELIHGQQCTIVVAVFALVFSADEVHT